MPRLLPSRARRIALSLSASLVLSILAPLHAAPARAQDLDEEGCVFERRIHPEGEEMCQSGTLKRCEDGAWADIGVCKDGAMPPPGTGEGDSETEPEE